MAEALSPSIVETTDQSFMPDVVERSQQLPVLVEFHIAGSPECAAAAEILAAAAGRSKGRWVLARVDVSQHRMVASQLGLRGVPTVLAFKDGRPVDQLVGRVTAEELDGLLGRVVVDPMTPVLRQAETFLAREQLDRAEAVLQEGRKRHGSSPEVLTLLARVRAAGGDQKAALDFLGEIPSNELSDAARGLLAELRFGAAPAELDPAALQARIEADAEDYEARYQLALHQARLGEFEAALKNLLAIVRKDREFREDGARKSMVEIFEVIGVRSPLSERYRKKLSWAIF